MHFICIKIINMKFLLKITTICENMYNKKQFYHKLIWLYNKYLDQSTINRRYKEKYAIYIALHP